MPGNTCTVPTCSTAIWECMAFFGQHLKAGIYTIMRQSSESCSRAGHAQCRSLGLHICPQASDAAPSICQGWQMTFVRLSYGPTAGQSAKTQGSPCQDARSHWIRAYSSLVGDRLNAFPLDVQSFKNQKQLLTTSLQIVV